MAAAPDHTDPLRPKDYRLLINLPDAHDRGEAMQEAARIFGAAKCQDAKIVAGSRFMFSDSRDGYRTKTGSQATGFRVYIPY